MAGFGAAANGGAVDILADGGVPRSFTGIATEVISGGQFVTTSGAANLIGSEAGTRSPGSIVLALISDTSHIVGIAAFNVGSEGILTVNTRGTYIATSAGEVSGGVGVYAVNATVQGVKPMPTTEAAYSGTQIGRAILPSASGTNLFTLVNFSF